jgi:hypothetical protein
MTSLASNDFLRDGENYKSGPGVLDGPRTGVTTPNKSSEGWGTALQSPKEGPPKTEIEKEHWDQSARHDYNPKNIEQTPPKVIAQSSGNTNKTVTNSSDNQAPPPSQ